jgi:hypothetical protein
LEGGAGFRGLGGALGKAGVRGITLQNRCPGANWTESGFR